MNSRKFVFCLASAAVFASTLMLWACGDSDSPVVVGEESSSSMESSSSSVALSSSFSLSFVLSSFLLRRTSSIFLRMRSFNSPAAFSV